MKEISHFLTNFVMKYIGIRWLHISPMNRTNFSCHYIHIYVLTQGKFPPRGLGGSRAYVLVSFMMCQNHKLTSCTYEWVMVHSVHLKIANAVTTELA